jgi:hypothetical protein
LKKGIKTIIANCAPKSQQEYLCIEMNIYASMTTHPRVPFLLGKLAGLLQRFNALKCGLGSIAGKKLT